MMTMMESNIFNSLQQIQAQSKSQVLTSFSPFLNNPLLSDVVFIIENQKFFAHKLVLAARSPYFYALITQNSQSTANTLEIEIQDASAFVFLQVLQWMYSGVVNWTDYLSHEKNVSTSGSRGNKSTAGAASTSSTPSIIWDLYQAGQFYQVHGLCDQCELKIVSMLSRENVFTNWKQAQIYNATNTLNYCIEFVKMEFAKELQHIHAQYYQPHSDPYQLQKQIHEVRQQFSGSEIYNTLQQYTFPFKTEKSSAKKETGASKQREQASAGGFSSIFGEITQKAVTFYDQISINEATINKTEIVKFDKWNRNAIPPPAYPTPESLAAFPQFFSASNAAQTGKEISDKKLCRRLSVIHGGSTRGVFLQHLISGLGKLLNAERASLFLLMSEEIYSQVALGEKQLYHTQNERHVMCCPVFGHRGAITGVLEIINGTPSGENHLRTVALLISLFLQETGLTGNTDAQQQQQQQPKTETHLVEPLSSDPVASLSQPLSLSGNSYRRQSIAHLQKLVRDTDSPSINEYLMLWENDDLAGGTTTGMDENNLSDWNVEDFLRSEDLLNVGEGSGRQSFTSSAITGLFSGTRASNPSLLDDLGGDNKPSSQATNNLPSNKKRKRSDIATQQQQQTSAPIPSQQNDPNVPFMHFRIPRYELQFIQFEGESSKKKK